MLNYILPPIIIVISVSILVVFLFRKAAQIPAGDFIDDANEREEKKKGSSVVAAVSQFGLKLLERLMHRSKLLSLKMHNVSNVGFQTIREKRQRSTQLQKEVQERKMLDEQVEQDAGTQRIVGDDVVTQPVATNFSKEKQARRPMIMEAVTMPHQSTAKEKNQLEEVLIKRIAINPRDIEAYERLGDYYLESANFQDSLECFKQVLLLSPAHHKAKTRIRRLEKMK
jgi:tetratricopeptide (TPR) repeat protein